MFRMKLLEMLSRNDKTVFCSNSYEIFSYGIFSLFLLSFIICCLILKKIIRRIKEIELSFISYYDIIHQFDNRQHDFLCFQRGI